MKKSRKETILETAKDLFSKSGFDGCSMDDIAKKAEVNKATLYYHYKDKSTLYETVLVSNLEQFYEKAKVLSKTPKDPKERLLGFVTAFGENFDCNKTMASLMLNEVSTGGRNLTKNVSAVMKKIVGLLKEILDTGVEEGVFKDINPMILHFMIVGSMNMYISSEPFRNKELVFGGDLSPKEMAKEIEKIVLNGIRRS